MARPLLLAEDLHVTLGGRALLDGAAFQVEPGERVALVGENGSGKTTLLRIVQGALEPDFGTMQRRPQLAVSQYAQHHEFVKGATIRDVLAAEREAPSVLAAELAALEARVADPALYDSVEADSVLARYGEVQRELQAARAGASAGAGAEDELTVLHEELGFGEADLARDVATLSGGQRTRLFLARALSNAAPDGLLVLDEPTNHLDVETIEWLEEWLLDHAGTVIMVAHDRAFLDNVSTRVLSLRDGRIDSYPGNYTAFEAAVAEDQERLARRREREAKEVARQKAVIEQFKKQKRFNGQYASRVTRLEKYRAAVDKTPDPLVKKLAMAVKFPEAAKSSNDIIRVRGLGKKLGERLLMYGLDMDVQKGDRIGLVGENGVGKTTLLRMLVGREKKDVGSIEVAPGVRGAYYAQGNEDLDVARSLGDELLRARPGIEVEDVRALLGRFGFRRESDATRKVAGLSGGERARLSLLKTILAPSNLLVLDEPTNHLDLESRQALVGALNAYEGTLLLVSHDRWLLDSVVDKIAVLARKEIRIFRGDFTTARERAALDDFTVEKPTAYVVRKAFKDYDSGVRHTVGSTLLLTPAELAAKRLYRTAVSLGWMETG